MGPAHGKAGPASRGGRAQPGASCLLSGRTGPPLCRFAVNFKWNNGWKVLSIGLDINKHSRTTGDDDDGDTDLRLLGSSVHPSVPCGSSLFSCPVPAEWGCQPFDTCLKAEAPPNREMRGEGAGEESELCQEAWGRTGTGTAVVCDVFAAGKGPLALPDGHVDRHERQQPRGAAKASVRNDRGKGPGLGSGHLGDRGDPKSGCPGCSVRLSSCSFLAFCVQWEL